MKIAEKNKVDPKYRLTGIPTVIQSSVRTFSAGEFATDTIKNLNPNAIHIGHNTGGGGNMTFGTFTDEEMDNKDLSSTEKAKLVATSFKNGYVDEEIGEKIYDSIMKKIKDGSINDKMTLAEVIKITHKAAFDASGDGHVKVEENPSMPGCIISGVPQVKSDRVVVDPKTRYLS